MNREILFKAKRKSSRKQYQTWVYGYLFKDLDGTCQILFNNKNGDVEFEDVIPETVSQYSGLTDKNGVKIFENDVVFYSDFANVYKDDITGVIKYTQDCMFEIEYDDKYVRGGKTTWPLVCHEHPIFTSKKIEVIGNIFDNKEFDEEVK